MKSAEKPPQQTPELEINSEESATEKQQESSKNKSKFSGWLLAILLLGGGTALWQIFTPSSAPTAQTSTQAPPPRPVETIALTTGTGNRQIRLLGQVEAGERKATLSPQIDSTVQRVLVREGDRVTPGMTVAILDDADPRLALAEARARLAQERSNLARLQVGTRP